MQPRGLAYWEGLAKILDEESVHERDRMVMGMLQPLGIEKGKPFAPTARQKKILEEAAIAGELMARTIACEKRFEGATIWPGKHRRTGLSVCSQMALLSTFRMQVIPALTPLLIGHLMALRMGMSLRLQSMYPTKPLP